VDEAERLFDEAERARVAPGDVYVTEATANLYERSAKLGHARAMFMLAQCFRKGEGRPKDGEAASMWYQRAAELGDPTAQGVCFDFGYGGAQDTREAVRWYLRAAEQGLAEAQFNLGVCYEKGTEKKKLKPFVDA
jgi:TPR repeat protein